MSGQGEVLKSKADGSFLLSDNTVPWIFFSYLRKSTQLLDLVDEKCFVFIHVSSDRCHLSRSVMLSIFTFPFMLYYIIICPCLT